MSVENSGKAGSKAKAIFFISKKQWHQHHWSKRKIDLVLRHAQALVIELAAINIELMLVELDSFNQQVSYLKRYCSEQGIMEVIANSELEFNEQQRDQQCISAGITLTLFEADVIVPKGKVLNQSGTMFKVFTPFKRAWLKYIKQYGFEYLGKASQSPSKGNFDHLDIDANLKLETDSWPLARVVEQQALPSFLQNKLADYDRHRDIPSINGTSSLSPYLAAGLISPRYVLQLLINQAPDILTATDSANLTWLNELIWRDFYRHLMFHHPKLSKNHCFKEKYQQYTWPNNIDHFKAWCQGRTGYPLVDAAMRQLQKTGWMHNRLRMVVASFLTKHLLIDWRWGERYFMQQLIDGDLAANNGGWQWAASTGCDAQPYFRIFNPIRQSEKFDPNGNFIRKYLPELANIPDKNIHFPHQYIEKHQLECYWPAIVEHKQARVKALSFYK